MSNSKDYVKNSQKSTGKKKEATHKKVRKATMRRAFQMFLKYVRRGSNSVTGKCEVKAQ